MFLYSANVLKETRIICCEYCFWRGKFSCQKLLRVYPIKYDKCFLVSHGLHLCFEGLKLTQI